MSRSIRVIIAAKAACGVGCDRYPSETSSGPVILASASALTNGVSGNFPFNGVQRILRHAQLCVRDGVVEIHEERPAVVALE